MCSLANASLCVLAPHPAVTKEKIQALLAGGERRSDKCVSATSSSTKAEICLVSVKRIRGQKTLFKRASERPHHLFKIKFLLD